MAPSSMTGFGRASGQLSDRYAATVVVRSVNHRYLDVQVRTNLREETPELEAAVRSVVAEPLARGRVTVQVDLSRTQPGGTEVMINSDAVASVLEQLRRLEQREGTGGSVSLKDVLTVPGLVSVRGESTMLEPEETEALRGVASKALAQLLAMRRDEGARLTLQLESELEHLRRFLDWFEPQIDGTGERILERLRERLERLLGPGAAVEPERLAQEAALIADRGDVSEEVVRLRGHLAGCQDRIREGGAVGRALDFLCQEIHRELNTLGSKCREMGVADRLVEAKAATERLREQVQNLE